MFAYTLDFENGIIMIRIRDAIELSTIGLCPCNMGWSKAGWWWDGTQSIVSPSGLWNHPKNTNLVRTIYSDGVDLEAFVYDIFLRKKWELVEI